MTDDRVADLSEWLRDFAQGEAPMHATDRLLKAADVVDAAIAWEQWGHGSDAPDLCKRDFQRLRDAVLAYKEASREG